MAFIIAGGFILSKAPFMSSRVVMTKLFIVEALFNFVDSGRESMLRKKNAEAQAKVSHILRPGKASEKTPKGVIPPTLCEISQNASRKKMVTESKARNMWEGKRRS
jgi:hypothetical protein